MPINYDIEYPALERKYVKLKTLLEECIDHLEYTNFGDAWENECAEKLIEKIEQYQTERTK